VTEVLFEEDETFGNFVDVDGACVDCVDVMTGTLYEDVGTVLLFCCV
jgi:hypothetical protein